MSQNINRTGGSAIDGRTTRHAGYQVSQRKRKRIEEVFGWLKTVGMLRKTRHRGVFKVGWVFTLRRPPTTGLEAFPATRWRSSVRVSAWSRGERSRPACGHSVSGGKPNDDENCVVLLAAAVHDGHGGRFTGKLQTTLRAPRMVRGS